MIMDYFASSDFSALAEQLIKQHHLPGLAVAVVQNGKVSSSGYGKARLEPPEPFSPDTLFDIASCSKSFTAALIGQLVEDSSCPEVQYQATMSSLLPDDFVMPSKEYTDGVTLDDVLGHATGTGRHDNSYMSPRAKEPDTPRSITRNLRNLPVVAPLRSKHIYNNMMYTVATHLLEVKTQQPFSRLLQAQLLDPLNMSSTSLQPSSALEKGMGDRIATGYIWHKPTKTFRDMEMRDQPEAQGAGSIVTSANDFILWVKALVNREGPINEKIYQGLIRLRSIATPGLGRLRRFESPEFYAAGLEVWFYRGYMLIGHEGGEPGFTSRFLFIPELRFGAVFLANASEATQVVSTLANRLIDKAIGVPEDDAKKKSEKGHEERKGEELRTADPVTDPSTSECLPEQDKQQASNPTEEHREQEDQKTPSEAHDRTESTLKPSEPQQVPLDAYTGDYWNPGYHTLSLEVKDGSLFIDATDRTMGFTLTFEHLANQREYSAHLCDMYEGGDEHMDASFVFENDSPAKLGLRLEWGWEELIWFEKVER